MDGVCLSKCSKSSAVAVICCFLCRCSHSCRPFQRRPPTTSSSRLGIWSGPRWGRTPGGLAWCPVIHSLTCIPKLIQEVREEALCQSVRCLELFLCYKCLHSKLPLWDKFCCVSAEQDSSDTQRTSTWYSAGGTVGMGLCTGVCAFLKSV